MGVEENNERAVNRKKDGQLMGAHGGGRKQRESCYCQSGRKKEGQLMVVEENNRELPLISDEQLMRGHGKEIMREVLL